VTASTYFEYYITMYITTLTQDDTLMCLWQI